VPRNGRNEGELYGSESGCIYDEPKRISESPGLIGLCSSNRGRVAGDHYSHELGRTRAGKLGSLE
jgi:hypothetical protein